MNVANELNNHLQTFEDYLGTLGRKISIFYLSYIFLFQVNNLLIMIKFRSAVISRDDRKYYLDLKENERGRFLRISMVGINNPRTQIAIPAQGIQELRGTLTSLIDEFGKEDDRGKILKSINFDSTLPFSDSIESPPAIGKFLINIQSNHTYLFVLEPAELPESKYLRVGNKNFYFDIGSNDRGIFLRISEVKTKPIHLNFELILSI